MIRFAVVLLAALLAVPVASASERHPKQSELEGEVMCPVCGTTLDQSNSPAAEQIKRVIAQRIAGIVAGAVVVGFGAWRWSRAREREPDLPRLDPAQERRLDDELARWD